MARQVLPIVGAVVGAYFGNPQLGWAIGTAIGNAVDPQVLPGPKIGEIAQQTSQEGGPRPIIFALSAPIAGNIIVSGPPRIVRKKKSQGKGGPKVETESVYRTYAIGVCEGPITEFVRIWRNGILVYDVSEDPQLSAADNNAFLQTARFFLGDYKQLPSPDIQSITANAPAHRGTAYMVMANEDLTDLRGMVPQFQFQVLRCEGYFLTSKPYPIERTEALDVSARLVPGLLYTVPGPTIIDAGTYTDALDMEADLVGGSLRDPLRTYELAEALDVSASLATSVLRVGVVLVEIDPEALDVSASLEGTLREALILYTIDPEALDVSASLSGGSLE